MLPQGIRGVSSFQHGRAYTRVSRVGRWTSISVFALVRYMTNHGIPMDARITADTFHDRPFLELTWETT
jgi:hypothetical protein